MSEISILQENQIVGVNKIDVLKILGNKCAITDFAILLGGDVFDNKVEYDNTLKGRTGFYYVKLNDSDYYYDPKCILVIDESGNYYEIENCLSRNACIRPILSFSNIHDYGVINQQKTSGILEIEYGEYPQYVVDNDLNEKLEKLLWSGDLTITGKNYTTDSVHYYDGKQNMNPIKHIEYEFEGRKYIRLLGDENGKSSIISNGLRIEIGKPYWIEVSPIKWLVDDVSKLLVSKNLLLSGIRICSFDKVLKEIYWYKKSDVAYFLNNYFINEIKPLANLEESYQFDNNPYHFIYDKLNEEDTIKLMIESDVPVLLHGNNNEAKSLLVKKMDSNCTTLYLKNNLLETLTGKSEYNNVTKEMVNVKPMWLIELEEKCLSEPDKIHILYLRNINESNSNIQDLIYHLVLDRKVNGIWKLPNNVRMIADEYIYSLLNFKNMELSEMLSNEFVHIDINANLRTWLKLSRLNNEENKLDFIKIEDKILHPAIYTYIIYMQDKVLKDDSMGINLDLKKWQLASNILYKTKNPRLLINLFDEERVNDFCDFCNKNIITLEQVLYNNYINLDNYVNPSYKYITTLGLTQVDEENVELVRDFVSSKLGEGYVKVFDFYWSYKDNNRLRLLYELTQEKEKNTQKVLAKRF